MKYSSIATATLSKSTVSLLTDTATNVNTISSQPL